jgi:hypothetical protein
MFAEIGCNCRNDPGGDNQDVNQRQDYGRATPSRVSVRVRHEEAEFRTIVDKLTYVVASAPKLRAMLLARP